MDHCIDNVPYGNSALPSDMKSQDEEDEGQGKKLRERDQNEVKEDVPIENIMKRIIASVNKSHKQAEDVVDVDKKQK